MFNQFRVHYPKGSLVTELVTFEQGKYIVRCLVQDEGKTLVTGLAAAETVEVAEDKARNRALAILGIDTTTTTGERETPLPTSEVPLTTMTAVASAFASPNLGQRQPHRFSEATVASNVSSVSSLEPKREKVTRRASTKPLVADEITFTHDISSAELETSQDEVETPLWMSEKMPQSQHNDVPVMSYSPSSLETDTPETLVSNTPIDFSEIIARTNVELKRLGWTTQQGKDYLLQTYGKKSRQLLTDGELLDFLHHLESQPAPEE